MLFRTGYILRKVNMKQVFTYVYREYIKCNKRNKLQKLFIYQSFTTLTLTPYTHPAHSHSCITQKAWRALKFCRTPITRHPLPLTIISRPLKLNWTIFKLIPIWGKRTSIHQIYKSPGFGLYNRIVLWKFNNDNALAWRVLLQVVPGIQPGLSTAWSAWRQGGRGGDGLLPRQASWAGSAHQ